MSASRRRLGGLLPPMTEEERTRALADPGPSWRDFFFREFLKWWIGLGFFVANALIVASFLQPFEPAVFVPALAGAIYLEILGYRFLYYRPDPNVESPRAEFHPTWFRLRRYGRWTPEFERLRAGVDPMPGAATGPDARDFF